MRYVLLTAAGVAALVIAVVGGLLPGGDTDERLDRPIALEDASGAGGVVPARRARSCGCRRHSVRRAGRRRRDFDRS